MRCAEHGVRQVPVPWADAQARFTALFEAMVIDWLKVVSFAAVARQCRLSWDQVAGIQARAVRRGLSRRAVAAAPLVGVDETSFQRRHEYVTVVNDLTASEPRVLYVADGRDRAGPRRLLRRGGRGRLRADRDGGDGHVAGLHRVGARPHRGAHCLLDTFHIAQHLGATVDQVRRSENRALRQQGDDRLAKTRYLWLTRPANLTPRQRRAFTPLRTSALRVARAWAIKELAMQLWHYRSRGWAGPHVEPLVRVGDSQSVGADPRRSRG